MKFLQENCCYHDAFLNLSTEKITQHRPHAFSAPTQLDLEEKNKNTGKLIKWAIGEKKFLDLKPLFMENNKPQLKALSKKDKAIAQFAKNLCCAAYIQKIYDLFILALNAGSHILYKFFKEKLILDALSKIQLPVWTILKEFSPPSSAVNNNEGCIFVFVFNDTIKQ